MKKACKFFLLFICFLLMSCVANKGSNAPDSNFSEMWEWDSTRYYKEKIVGRVVIFTPKFLFNDFKVTVLNPKFLRGMPVVGTLKSNEAFEVSLIEGDYTFFSTTASSSEGRRQIKVNVKGGEIVYIKEDGKTLNYVEALPDELVYKRRGVMMSKFDFDKQMKVTISASYNLYSAEENKTINVSVVNGNGMPVFKLNGAAVKHESRLGNNYVLIVKLQKGDNELVIESYGFDKKLISKSITLHIKTDKELQEAVLAAKDAEKKRIEQERLKKIQAEKELKAKKLEEERLAREGDGTPDDLSCKKYGLKPQTQGYSECRMRLDLARQDAQREQARATAAASANAQAREEARKAELQRRYEEVERQNAIIANRESKCRFVQSAEYAKPTLGGFFESMNRANSAYDNCMAGVPQINTSCSKDAFGNINCTSK